MIKTKIALCICFCISLSAIVFAQDTKTRFYIVRHAEKDTGANPALSLKGQKRAGDLYRLLKHRKIDLILVSQYRRTAMTADSIRLNNKVEVLEYKADATGESVGKLVEANAGKAKNILIIGHSNTLPAIVRTLGVTDYTEREIPDSEYDNLFIVEIKNGKSTLKKEKYGTASLPSTTPQKMVLQ